MPSFDDPRTGTGTREWAEVTENISRGCKHRCLYCYSAANAKRFQLRARSDWEREELTKRAFITSYPARDGTIMFPSAHDISEALAPTFIRVAKLMLEKNNKLLIVSKPHLSVIDQLCREFLPHREQILFRFSIGSFDEAISRHWEPGAPAPQERLQALQLAYAQGYRTSISAEPLLGDVDTAREILSTVRPYVTDTVWFGKMNKIRTRVDCTIPENLAHVELIERQQTDVEVLRLFDALNGEPLVRWKDSVREVIARHRG